MGSILFVLAIISIGFFMYDTCGIQKKFTLFLATSLLIFGSLFLGYVNVLKIGVGAIYAIIILWSIYCIVFKSIKIKEYILSLPIVLFIFSSFLFILIYTLKPPFFCAWDEFSHWGPYLKNIKYSNQLHIYTEYNFVHPAYPQAMTVLYYVGSYFNRVYSESSVLLIYSIFLHACVCTLIPDIGRGVNADSDSKIVVILYALFVPFACLLFPYIGYAAPYTSAYLDVIVGAFFGSSMLFILETSKKEIKNSLLIAITMFVLLQIKDISITFYLICIATYLVETIVVIYKERNKIFKYVGQYIVCGLVVPLLGKKVWNYIINITGNNIDQFDNSNLENFIKLIKDYMQGTNDYFAKIGKAYWYGIKHVNVMWTGIPILVIAIILIIVGFILSSKYSKKGKKYVYIYSVSSVGYFMCYLLVLLAIYLCGMSEAEALSNASMDRYIGSFFNGWSFILFGITTKYLYYNSKQLLQLVMLVSILFIYLSIAFCDIPYTKMNKENTGIEFFERHGENIVNNVENTESVWLQSDEENWYQKFIMKYESYPIEINGELNMDFSLYNGQEMIDIMKSKQIKYIYILNGEEEFINFNKQYISYVYDLKTSGALLRLNNEKLELIY